MSFNPTTIQLIAAVVFALALVHTFTASMIERLSHRYPAHSGLFHLLGEVEVVFGFWAFVLMCVMALLNGSQDAIEYVESRKYTEPLFVFVVMVVAASRPVLQAVSAALGWIAKLVPINTSVAEAWLVLAGVPLLGSLITEPAAMTIAALTLANIVFRPEVPERVKYSALGVLFVNISIGGTLTAYAAPPVLMVAGTWNWDSAFMLNHFGWKAAVAVLINATVVTWFLRKHLKEVAITDVASEEDPSVPPASAPVKVPMVVTCVHFAFLAMVVLTAHHPAVFVCLFMLFLGYTQAYKHFQSPLIIKEGLLVGFFLAGLVVLGGLQQWWLEPIVSSLSPVSLFIGSLGLTAITDNAALTYLGSLITDMSDASKYMLVAGAVCGGGLTVIANAPNPAGVALLRKGFADGTIGAGDLFLAALPPTAVAALAFFFL